MKLLREKRFLMGSVSTCSCVVIFLRISEKTWNNCPNYDRMVFGMEQAFFTTKESQLVSNFQNEYSTLVSLKYEGNIPCFPSFAACLSILFHQIL